MVLCYSKKMNAVARSIIETEMVGITKVLKQVIWLRRLVTILERHQSELVTVPVFHRDNKGAVQGTHGASNTSKVKYIDVAYYHII